MATQKRFIAKNGLDNNSNTITNVSDPSGLQDAATKNYVSSNIVRASSSAYPTVQPSLNLDFANTKQLDPRITFVRNSTATYYDGQTTALAEQNLLTYSQGAFSNTTYYGSLLGATITDNNVTAPDGTLTASTFTATAQFSSIRTVFNCPVGTHTFSIYAYRTSGTNLIYVYTNGGTLLGSYSPTSTWARYSITFTLATSEAVYIVQDRATSGFTPIYIWGAQLEQRSSVTTYTPTTTAAITNYIPVLMTAPANTPRFDCDPITGKSLGLLIEESRTNLVTYSENFDNAVWTTLRATIISNAVVAPDGTNTADKLVEDTQTGAHRTGKGSYSFIVSTTYCLSVYVKAAERSNGTLGLGNGIALFGTGGNAFAHYDLIAGTCVISSSNASSAGIQNISNGWFRVWLVATCTTAGSDTYFATFLRNGTATTTTYTGDGTSGLYLWGAQLEVGAFPTSYIPTVASQVTRAADDASMTGTNFSSWYNQSQGAVYTELNLLGTVGGTIQFGCIFSNSSNVASNVSIQAYNSSGQMRFILGNGTTNTIVADYTAVTPAYMKGALSYYPSNCIAGFNGASTTNTTITIMPPSIDALQIGSGRSSIRYLNGHIRKLSYYPVALSSSNLVALTS